MSEQDIVNNREFLGNIINAIDPKNMGRYKVHIPVLMQHLSEDVGIWCKNNVDQYRITNSSAGTYGSYMPLHIGTQVLVRFFDNDFNTGYIQKVVSDSSNDTVLNPSSYLAWKDKKEDSDHQQNPAPAKPQSRDEHYIMLLTRGYVDPETKEKKGNNIIYVTEKTISDKDSKKDEHTPNEMWMSYNTCRTAIRFSEDGIKLTCHDNSNERIKGVSSTHVSEDINIKTDKSYNIHITEDNNVFIEGNVKVYIKGDATISVDGKTNLYSAGGTNIDGGEIHLNSGKATKEEVDGLDDVEFLSQKDTRISQA